MSRPHANSKPSMSIATSAIASSRNSAAATFISVAAGQGSMPAWIAQPAKTGAECGARQS